MHKEILSKFKELCPTIICKMWWKKGHNAIKIRTDVSDVVFTYNDKDDWKIETKKMFEAAEAKA